MGSQEITRGRANNVSQVGGDSDIVLACWVVREGLRKSTMASASSSLLVKLDPSVLTLILNTSIPSLMPLEPFKLLPQCWSSEGVNLSKSMSRPFKRNFLGLQSPSISLSLNPCWVLEPEVIGAYLLCTGTLG